MRFLTRPIELPENATFRSAMNANVSRALDQAADILLKAIYRRLIPHKKSGSLLLSWKKEKVSNSLIEVYSDSPVSIWLDEGTGQQTGGRIYPRNAKVLGPMEMPASLRNRRTGEIFPGEPGETDTLYFKSVKGQRGIHYFEEAWLEAEPEIDALLGKAVADALRESIGKIAYVPSYMQVSPRTGKVFYGRRGAGGRFISRSS